MSKGKADSGDAIPDGIEFTLSRPVQAHGEDLSALNFRAPATRDLRTLGNPLIFRDDGSFSFDNDKMAKFMVHLGKVPMSTVDQMAPGDFNAAAMELASAFFSTG